MSDIAEARPASTVVLLRDGASGLETLMLRRNKALLFAGGLWVFPGGALDEADFCADSSDIEAAARIAAAREAQEEAGLVPKLEDMVLLSHWTTPVQEPKRFATWIYAAPVAADEEVVIDGGEIHDSRWLSVGAVIKAHERGEMGMLPPTYLTLCTLAHYTTVTQLVAAERTAPVPEVFPVFATQGESVAVMFRGDAGYDSGDGTLPGPRHRAILRDKTWTYYHDDVDPAYPPLIRSTAGS